jgi:hypothetical protein
MCFSGPSNTTILHSDIEKLKMENLRMMEELNKKTGEVIFFKFKLHHWWPTGMVGEGFWLYVLK